MAVLREYVSSRNFTPRTIQRMYKFAGTGRTDVKLVEIASDIIKANNLGPQCGFKDFRCQVDKIFRFVEGRVQYVHDPVGAEWVQDAWATLLRGAGDCDDSSVLTATLAGALGRDYRFVTIAEKPGVWSHVFPIIEVPGQGWVAADATVNKPLGWLPPKNLQSKVWERKA